MRFSRLAADASPFGKSASAASDFKICAVCHKTKRDKSTRWARTARHHLSRARRATQIRPFLDDESGGDHLGGCRAGIGDRRPKLMFQGQPCTGLGQSVRFDTSSRGRAGLPHWLAEPRVGTRPRRSLFARGCRQVVSFRAGFRWLALGDACLLVGCELLRLARDIGAN